MIYDFTVYRADGRETLVITVEAEDERAARRELEDRMAGLAITAGQRGEWRVAVTVIRQGREGSHENPV